MEKLLSRFFVVLFMALATVGMTSCSGDDDDEPKDKAEPTIVGSWIQEDSELPYSLTFTEGGTGTLSVTIIDDSRATLTMTQYFSYSTSVSSTGITFFTLVHNSGDVLFNNGRWNYDLVENGKRLVLNDGELIFKRIN